MEENAFKNNYHMQGYTDVKMLFDDVKIPLKNQATGTNYQPSRFGMDMRRFFSGLGVTASIDVQGNTIYVTIK